MKKVLILTTFLILIGNTGLYANHCGHDTTRSWKFTSTYNSSYAVNKSRAKYALWTFKNKTNKKITIKSIGLWSTNREIMKEQKFDKYLKPFGVIELKMYVGDLNLDVSGSGFSRCTYGKPPKKSSQPLYKKPSTQKKYTYKKPKKYDDNFTLLNLFLLLISGLLIAVFVAATKKNQYKRYVKNFPIIFDFADNTIACFKKYSAFQGKSSRKEFWYFYLFTFIVSFLTYLIDVSIFRKDPDGILFINTFFAMITFLPSLAAGCRRLHDVNKSGWWQLISITVIGIIPLIIWLASKPVKEKNKY